MSITSHLVSTVVGEVVHRVFQSTPTQYTPTAHVLGAYSQGHLPHTRVFVTPELRDEYVRQIVFEAFKEYDLSPPVSLSIPQLIREHNIRCSPKSRIVLFVDDVPVSG